MIEIYNSVLEDINSFKDSISSATSVSKNLVDTYKLFIAYNLKDADLLKERIKEKVTEALNDEIL